MAEFITLAEAAALVSNGCTLALGGMTLYRRPVAFVRALLARPHPPRDLTLLTFAAGYESDLLVGAGCVSAVRTAYFGLESFGFAPMFTQAAGEGRLRVIEETEVSLALGFRAALVGAPFAASGAWVGTDLPRLRPDVAALHDPYSGAALMAFPALRPDVVVIHALAADRAGNFVLNNNLGVDLELVYITPTVIVTVETLVERCERSLDGTLVPPPGATHIVHAPKGAYPTSCYPAYPLAGGELLRYLDWCAEGRFDDYLRGLISAPPFMRLDQA